MRIHCNICATLVSKTVPAFITSCSHIFCQPCLRMATKNTCPLCKTRSAAIPLDKSMPKKVQLVFMDKSTDQVQETIKIRRFRLLQYSILRQLTVKRLQRIRNQHAKLQRIRLEKQKAATHQKRIAMVRQMRLEIRTKCSKLFKAMKNRAPLEIVRQLYASAKRTCSRCEQLMATACRKFE